MEKLTLEHILSFGNGLIFKDEYLLYELEAIFFDLYEERGAFLKVIDKTLTTSMWYNNTKSAKPILRPMDLTKPIIVEGKEVIPVECLVRLKENYPIIDNIAFTAGGYFYNFRHEKMKYSMNGGLFLDKLSIHQFQWLFKNKFDVFGLIEKGLAIDVNTLTANPYN